MYRIPGCYKLIDIDIILDKLNRALHTLWDSSESKYKGRTLEHFPHESEAEEEQSEAPNNLNGDENSAEMEERKVEVEGMETYIENREQAVTREIADLILSKGREKKLLTGE